MQNRVSLRIFLSSPGDVAAERKVAREVLNDLQADPLLRDEVHFEIIAWEDPTSRVLMPAPLTPQQAINQGLPKPSEADAVIVILWGRMGTPLDIDKHGTKANGEPYWSGTEWEYLDAVRGMKEHPTSLPIVLLYRRTDTPPVPDLGNLDTLEEYLTQRKRVQRFLEDFRDPTTSAYRGNVIRYANLDEFRKQFAFDARLVVREIRKRREATSNAQHIYNIGMGIGETARVNWKGSPFPGLRAFTEKDEQIFFGRGSESADLIKRLTTQRLIFIVGSSGSGKSSLAGAGLIPKLKRGAMYGVAAWHIVYMTPGNDPFRRLAYSLLHTIPALQDPIADDEERADQLANVLRKSPKKLADQAAKWLASEAEDTEILLIIDQFEELFTSSLLEDQLAFSEVLKNLSHQLRAVATMRSDFYDRALNYFEETLRNASFTLGTPSPVALYEMIVQPARATGLEFDAGLPEEIVSKTMGQPGGLALVAYLLEELYLRAISRGDSHLTRADYEMLGGVEKAIASRAQTVYRDLNVPEERKQKALQRLFHELVEPITVDGTTVATRRRAPVAQFAQDYDVIHLITSFVQARLLVLDRGMVEVAHEALLREWDELAVWIATIVDDLRLLRQFERDAADWYQRGANPHDQPRAEQLRSFYAALERLSQRRWDLPQRLRDYTEPEQDRLLHELQTLDTDHERRRDIGDRLSAIGDARIGVGAANGVADIDWLPVLGSHQITPFRDQLDNIYGSFAVHPFFIAKYQITFAQFSEFINAIDGYYSGDWWNDMPADMRRQDIKNPRTKTHNAPRDSVSWYQAVAFSRWLHSRLSGIQLVHPHNNTTFCIGRNTEIRLPTEWEWQWAAQNGDEKRLYPWGEWSDNYANTSEAGLGRAIAVGMYPHGQAHCGTLDMSGNLTDWCLNDFENPHIVAGYYNEQSKVLRGGSFYHSQELATTVYRRSLLPSNAFSNFGFRVVIGSLL
jgi:hypothetical protein